MWECVGGTGDEGMQGGGRKENGVAKNFVLRMSFAHPPEYAYVVFVCK